MPDVQNFHSARLQHNPVIDMQWRMLESTDSRATMHGRAQMRKIFQQVNMIEESSGKPFTGSRMVLPRPVHDLLEIR